MPDSTHTNIREIVEAGAGCGKTTSLVARYMAALGQHSDRELIKRYAPPPNKRYPEAREILALTFTKEAAAQMQERIITALLKDGRTLEAQAVQEESQISTYHSFCLKLIQPHLDELGYFGPLLNPQIAAQKRREDFLQAFSQFPKKVALRKFFSIDQSIELSLKLLHAPEPKEYLKNIQNKHKVISDKFKLFLKNHTAKAQNLMLSDLSDKAKGATLTKWSAALQNSELSELENISLRFTKDIKEIYPDFVQDARNLKTFLQAGYLHSLESEFLKQELLAYELLWEFLAFSKNYINKYLDFEAVENELLILLQSKIQKSERLCPPPRLILVDEFQDTNPLQFSILEAISSSDTEWYFVGDPKQSIYAFRKSDVRLFYSMREKLSLINKDTNYRSAPDLLKLVNKLQDQMFKPEESEFDPPAQTLKWPESADSLEGTTHIHYLPNKKSTLGLAVQLSKEKILKGSTAVLFRSWKKLYEFSELLNKEQISYSISGSDNPFQNILSEMFCDYLDAQHTGDSKKIDLTFEKWKSPNQFSMDQTPESITALATSDLADWPQHLSNFIWIFQAHRFTGHEAWIAAMERWLKTQCEQAQNSHFNLSQLATFIKSKSSKIESINPYKNSGSIDGSLCLLTLHGSKGLEYDHVILPELFERSKNFDDISLENNDGHHSFAIEQFNERNEKLKSLFFEIEKLEERNKKFAEEKRLFYVALTRAKKSMTILAHLPSDKARNEDNALGVTGLAKAEAPYWNKYLLNLTHQKGVEIFSHEEDVAERAEESREAKDDSAAEMPNLPHTSPQNEWPQWHYPLPITNPSMPSKFSRMGVSEFLKIEEGNQDSEGNIKEKLAPKDLPTKVRIKAQESSDLGNLFHKFLERYNFRESIDTALPRLLGQEYSKHLPVINDALNALFELNELQDLFRNLATKPQNFQREFGLFLLSAEYRLTGFADLLWFKSKDELCIIDWKTGRNINTLSSIERLQKYEKQISLYAKSFAYSINKIEMIVVGIELSEIPKAKILIKKTF